MSLFSPDKPTVEVDKNEQTSNINPYRVPVSGESYEFENKFFYCVFGTGCEFENGRVVTKTVRIRETRFGEMAEIPLKDFEKWCMNKKRTDL